MATCIRITRFSVAGGIGKEGPEHTEVYSVVFDGPTDDSHARSASVGGKFIPQRGYQFAATVVEQATFVNNIDAAIEKDDASKWKVTVKYTTIDPANQVGEEPGEPTEPPLFVLPKSKLSTGTTRSSEERDHDALKRPVTNSANSYYTPLHTFEDGLDVLTITNYVLVYDEKKHRGKRLAVLSDKFMDYDEHTVLVDDIQTSPQEFERSDGIIVDYTQITFTLVQNPKGWLLWLLDHGRKQLAEESSIDRGVSRPAVYRQPSEGEDSQIADAANAQQEAITDKNGQPTDADVNLNGKGKPLSEGEKPVYLQFYRYQEVASIDLEIKTDFPAGGPRTP